MALPSLTAGDLVTRGPNYISISGDVVTDDNAVCIDTGNLLNVASYNKWALSTTAGVLDVFVNLGSGTFTTAPLSLFDGGGTAWNTTVLVTVANRVYYFYGSFAGIRCLENGATDIAGAWLRGWN